MEPMQEPGDDLRLVEVFRAENLPQAHAIRIALEEAGIPVDVQGEMLQGATGELPLGWSTSPRVCVPEQQAEQARVIIDKVEMLAQQESDGAEVDDDVFRCLSCRRPMEENQETCPACGWTYEPEAETP